MDINKDINEDITGKRKSDNDDGVESSKMSRHITEAIGYSELPYSPRDAMASIQRIIKGDPTDPTDPTDTCVISSHAVLEGICHNNEETGEIDIEVSEFSPPFKIIYTSVTPFFDVLNTTFGIICCLLFFIIDNFTKQQEIKLKKLERIKDYYLTVCLQSTTTRNKLKSANEDVGFNSIQVTQPANYSLFPTLATGRTETNKISNFPVHNYFCNNKKDTSPCGFIITTTAITIELSRIFQEEDDYRKDFFKRILLNLLGSKSSITVHSISNERENIMITLRKDNEDIYIDYDLYANFFACPIFCFFLYLFRRDAKLEDKETNESILTIVSIEMLTDYLMNELEMLSKYPIISLSGLALKKKLNKTCKDINDEHLSENVISEHMITEFNFKELCEFLKFNINNIPKFNILSLTCQTLQLDEEDIYKLYKQIAFNLFDADSDSFQEVGITPDMIRKLLISDNFTEFSYIISGSDMSENQRTIFSKKFPQKKRVELQNLLFGKLLPKFISKYRLGQKHYAVDVLRKHVHPEKFGGQKSKRKSKNPPKRKSKKNPKRKTKKNKKRKTNKKRKPRKFISKNYNYK